MVNFAANITTEELQKLPQLIFAGDIIVVNKESEIESALELLKDETILGFDTETKPSFTKGTSHKLALIQLAGENTAVLIRVQKTGFTPAIRKILESPNILKIGVALHDDIKRLGKVHSFVPKGFTDLQKMTIKYGLECNSLQKLAGVVLGQRISKSQQLSNWESASLSHPQQSYAAIDAWAARAIYLQFLQAPEIEQS